ncbi:MAG: tRNA pseudouridine(13) synthase TruD [Methylococcales symbiont of Iophon sp. n. MRB-2018]|nr:MAG: tRNA pseudouridine(13) synthase TruD [Methylococcales symbiont of Iophon sp. n. MRB-2018]KAF3979234.1 MAG: tRNA pseudouridine(13) synthase TruD [Methylococcales symbiont of Iophon sp. n. MRB-2018]
MSTNLTIEIAVCPYAYGSPKSSGTIKSTPDDFIVKENLSFQAEGSGEHAFLQIQKKGENTEDVARLLARFAKVRRGDVGYAGLKDRHGLTTQWFSIWLPGKDDSDWMQLESKNIKVLQSIRHVRKLKRGALLGNDFQIKVRDLTGDKNAIEKQLQSIKEKGFPNYFASQRFGHQGQNINKAIALFNGAKVNREQRSIYLSAARAYLFNLILAHRVKQENWNQAIAGDVFLLNKSNSYFKNNQICDSLMQRIVQGDIHPTAILYGKGEIETKADALAIEEYIIHSQECLVDGLLKWGLKASRRALRVIPDQLEWEFQKDSGIQLGFSLPSGSYATSLLREIVNFE